MSAVYLSRYGLLTALGRDFIAFDRICAGDGGEGEAPSWWDAGPVAPVAVPGRYRSYVLAEESLTGQDFDPQGLAVVFATTTSGMDEGEPAIFQHLSGEQPDHPLDLLWTNLPHQPGACLASTLGATGPVITISTACTSGTVAIGVAADLIRAGRCRRALVVGADAFCRTTLQGFRSLGAYTTQVCRPMDQGRDGMWLGEGAAWLLLERRPGPFRLVGVGVRTDGVHLTAPDDQGGGVRRAIQAALGEISGETVDHVNAHATGTEANDGAEARGIHAACPTARVSATKGATGHTLGAAGVVEAVLLLQSMERGVVPGLRSLQSPVPDLDLSAHSRVHPQELGVSINLAFGGHNAAVAFVRNRGGVEDEGVAPVLEVVVRARAGWGPAGASFSAEGRAEGEICSAPDPVRPDGVPVGSWRRLSRLARLAAVVTAAVGPLADPEIALFWGTSYGEYASTFQFLRSLHAKGPAGASPLAFQNSVHNAPAGHLSILFGLRGHSETLCAGPDTALLLIERAMIWVALHRKAALVVMGDEAGPDVQNGLRMAGVTGTLGEGAVALLLEPEGEGRRLRLVAQSSSGAWHRHRGWPGEPDFSAPRGTKAPEAVFGMAPVSDMFALLTCLEAGEGQVAWTGGRYSTTLEVR